jgi:hypothetical protein
MVEGWGARGGGRAGYRKWPTRSEVGENEQITATCRILTDLPVFVTDHPPASTKSKGGFCVGGENTVPLYAPKPQSRREHPLLPKDCPTEMCDSVTVEGGSVVPKWGIKCLFYDIATEYLLG